MLKHKRKICKLEIRYRFCIHGFYKSNIQLGLFINLALNICVELGNSYKNI